MAEAHFADRRKAILDAAEHAFALHGYNGVGMREIACMAGLHSSTIYHYFPGKEALFFAVIQRTYEEARSWIQQALALRPQGLERLTLFVERHLEFLLMHGNYLRILLHEILGQSPRLETIADKYIRPLMNLLKGFLQEMALEGTIGTASPTNALLQILSLNLGPLILAPFVVDEACPAGSLDPDYIRQLKKANVELLLNGMVRSVHRPALDQA